MSNLNESLGQLGGAKYFSCTDHYSGYHQTLIEKPERYKTAFATIEGLWQYKRAPFGLKHLPSFFSRLLRLVLASLIGTILFCFIDDIIVYSETLQQHIEILRKLFERLREANLKLHPEKCIFMKQEVAYLGHIISAEGVKPDPKKIKAVKEFLVPKNQKNIKSFLGLASY